MDEKRLAQRLEWINQHPDYFTTHSELMIGDTKATAIGNRFLLNYPLKVQVQCSRRLTEEQIEDKWKEILNIAEQGIHFPSFLSKMWWKKKQCNLPPQ